MTWHEFWVRTVLSSAVGSVVSVVTGLYVRHLVKRNREELLRVLGLVEGVSVYRKAPLMPQLARYRKAIAAGAGVMLTGLLTWVETADLEPVLGPLVPEPFRPLVGVGLGGLATIAGVITATNGPKPSTLEQTPPASQLAPSAASPKLEQLASPSSPSSSQPSTSAARPVPAPAAASAPAPAIEVTADAGAPYWAGIVRREPQASTSIVELLPAPERSYQ